MYLDDMNQECLFSAEILYHINLIDLFHQYRTGPASTSEQPALALDILLADRLQVLILISLKVIMDSCNNGM